MAKLTKIDKINIYHEWIKEYKPLYLNKKYGVNESTIVYLVRLIKLHGIAILNKYYWHYSKAYKKQAA